ncbi:MAG TPA: gluconeogenesis factor YvcK family protein [Anaerolineae bacterium]
MSRTPAPPRWIERLRAAGVFRWLTIGIGVKRWIVVLLAGTTLIGLGLAYVLIDVYRDVPLPGIFYYVTLQFLPHLVRGLILGAAGLALIGISLIRTGQSLLAPFERPGNVPIAEAMLQHRQRGRGPKIVAIGGGTGLSTLLRGIKLYTSNITAIVTVGDDGGSSGRLRREMGILPPGDFRQCIAALANDEALTTHLFKYRFNTRETGEDATGLGGHAFGNLFIVAMANITGSFESGLAESSRVLAVRGRVLPATVTPLILVGDLRDHQTNAVRRVEGESVITHAGATIVHLSIRPEDVHAYPDAIRAILDADLIALAPGSLFTSLLPNLLVPGIAEAIRAARGVCVYVCNVATQHGETMHFTIDDHLKTIEQYVGAGLVDAVIANSRGGIDWVDIPSGVGEMIAFEPGGSRKPPIFGYDVIDEAAPWRHDSPKLALALMETLGRLRLQPPRGRGRNRRIRPL